MPESYGKLKSLVQPPRSRVTQHPKISQFNTGDRGRGGRTRRRGCEGRRYSCGRGRGRGG